MYARLSQSLQNSFTAVSFNGASQFVAYSFTSSSFVTSDFTVECSFFVSQNSSNVSSHILQLDTGNINSRIALYLSGNTSLRFLSANGSGTAGDRITVSGITPGTWNHVALVRSGSTFTLFVNGTSRGTSSTLVIPTAGNLIVSVGTQRHTPNPGDWFSGFITNVRLTPSALYASTFTPPPATSAVLPASNSILCAPLQTDLADYSANSVTPAVAGGITTALGNSATVLDAVREIIQVMTGSITSTSQLTVFDRATSEIAATTASNWTLDYPANLSTHSNVFILKSACATSGKFKYARILLKGTATGEAFIEPTGSAVALSARNVFSNVFIELTSCRTASASSAVATNPTYYHAAGEGHIVGSTPITISASSRHLVLYSQYSATSNRVPLFMVLEHPENSITTSRNLIPVVTYRGSGGIITETTAFRETTTTPSTPAANVAQIPDSFIIQTGTSSALTTVSDADGFICTFDFGSAFPLSASTVDRHPLNSPGRRLITRDLVFYNPQGGHFFINASSLSKIAYIGGSGFYTSDSTYTSGSTTYAVLPLIASALVVPKE